MVQRINKYRADLRDIRFLLFEQLRVQELLASPRFSHWSEDEMQHGAR